MTVSDLRVLVNNLEEYIHIPDGIERLKKTVLHLAVTGQLVPQIASEGTGEELYREIQADRSKISVKKQKHLSEITEEVPFEIPVSWKWVKLGNIIELKSGADFTPDEYNDKGDGVLYITGASSIENEQIISNRWTTTPKNIANKGDLLLTCKGTVGTMAFLNEHSAHIARQLMAIKFNRNLVPEYIKSVISTNVTELQNAAQSMIPGISRDDVLGMAIPLPNLQEQKRILLALDSINELIFDLELKYKAEEAERSKFVNTSLLALSNEDSSIILENFVQTIKTKADVVVLRKTILQLAVSGKLVPQNPVEGSGEELFKQLQSSNNIKKQKTLLNITVDEIPFEIPNSWKWVRLGDLSEIFNGNSISKSEKSLKYENVTDGYPYLGTKDIGYGFEKIDYENGICIPFNEPKFKVIAAGTVLICSEGGSAGKKCGIVDREVCFGNKMYAFKAYGDSVLPEFILYNYLTDKFFSQFKNKMTGIIGGISTTKFKELLVPLPSLAEQNRIVQKTNELLALVTELEKQLDK
jgi:type I restriction enzyme S subunit